MAPSAVSVLWAWDCHRPWQAPSNGSRSTPRRDHCTPRIVQLLPQDLYCSAGMVHSRCPLHTRCQATHLGATGRWRASGAGRTRLPRQKSERRPFHDQTLVAAALRQLTFLAFTHPACLGFPGRPPYSVGGRIFAMRNLEHYLVQPRLFAAGFARTTRLEASSRRRRR